MVKSTFSVGRFPVDLPDVVLLIIISGKDKETRTMCSDNPLPKIEYFLIMLAYISE